MGNKKENLKVLTQNVYYLKTNYGRPFAFVYLENKNFDCENSAVVLAGENVGERITAELKLDKYILEWNLRGEQVNFEDNAVTFGEYDAFTCYRRDLENFRGYIKVSELEKEFNKLLKEYNQNFKEKLKLSYKEALIKHKYSFVKELEFNREAVTEKLTQQLIKSAINGRNEYITTIHSIMKNVFEKEKSVLDNIMEK